MVDARNLDHTVCRSEPAAEIEEPLVACRRAGVLSRMRVPRELEEERRRVAVLSRAEALCCGVFGDGVGVAGVLLQNIKGRSFCVGLNFADSWWRNSRILSARFFCCANRCVFRRDALSSPGSDHIYITLGSDDLPVHISHVFVSLIVISVMS